MRDGDNKIETHLGCTIMVVPHYVYEPYMHVDGRGRVNLSFTMEQPLDGRRVEVLLKPAERQRLGRLLLDPVWDDLVVVGDEH